MASLLVYVEAERLDELLPEAIAGETWQISPGTFTQPQLERLDEHSWLFVLSGTRCVAVLRNPRMEKGAFMGGPALVTNHDLAPVLHRLGCPEGRIAEWAATPRVVPPSDLDLLRYALGVSDDDAIDPVLPDDDRTKELRTAVWDDPISDDARMVYADHLLDRGDPRGELVSMQVLRARTGDFASDREKTLVRRIAIDCAQPISPYLAPGFELQRGFVARCTVNDTPMPQGILWHPAWRTVDDLSTANYELLVSPHVRARRVGLGGAQLRMLVDHARVLPFESVVGIAPIGKPQRGVWLAQDGWAYVMRTIGALENVRILSIAPQRDARASAHMLATLLRSPLGRQLRHLDMYTELVNAEPLRWREAFDEAPVPLLTLRFLPAPAPRLRWIGPEVLVGLRHTKRAPHVIIQVEDVLGPDALQVVVRLVAQLSRNVQRAELHDLGAPIDRVEVRQAALIAQLRPMFHELVIQPAGGHLPRSLRMRSLAP
jgi:uncharacterized protein (TIGR02996 family)